MIRTVALLCLLAPAFIDALTVGFRRKFGTNPFDKVFIHNPRNSTAAAEKGWVNVERPYSTVGYEALQLWCPANDYTFCILTDETDNAAGVQISVRVDTYTPVYDMEDLGFRIWSADVNGETIEYYTKAQYFVSSDAATRIAYPNPENTLIRNDYVTVEGFKDQVVHIAKYESDLDSVFYQQACIVWMGLHYYYNMTTEMECSSTTMFTWFALYDGGELDSVGFVLLGEPNVPEGAVDNFEHFDRTGIEMTVPLGPECLYDSVENNGISTLHIYFTEHPRTITCLS